LKKRFDRLFRSPYKPGSAAGDGNRNGGEEREKRKLEPDRRKRETSTDLLFDIVD
jgi:hypothetical protein